ncbi:MAG: hypothetical protein ACREAB_01575 [Blastocatellia bacterium]
MSARATARGNAVQIKGLSPNLHRKLIRATQLAGFRSLSEWLFRQTQLFIVEQEGIYGDLSNVFTPLERDVIKAIRRGANDPDHIQEETRIPKKKLARMLADLVSRDELEIRRQGGKTDQARGARRPLYFVTEEYQSKSK